MLSQLAKHSTPSPKETFIFPIAGLRNWVVSLSNDVPGRSMYRLPELLSYSGITIKHFGTWPIRRYGKHLRKKLATCHFQRYRDSRLDTDLYVCKKQF